MTDRELREWHEIGKRARYYATTLAAREMTEIILAHDLISKLSPKTVLWIEIQDRIDAESIRGDMERNRDETERETKHAEVLAKLTPEERQSVFGMSPLERMNYAPAVPEVSYVQELTYVSEDLMKGWVSNMIGKVKPPPPSDSTG